jgi:hypothetical protein
MGSTSRQAVSQELFYGAGTATARAVSEMNEAMQLAPLPQVSAAVDRAEMAS